MRKHGSGEGTSDSAFLLDEEIRYEGTRPPDFILFFEVECLVGCYALTCFLLQHAVVAGGDSQFYGRQRISEC
jgi:hypothetical protein